ncbi:helix-turn-helix domain-containing protein [Azospirillum picis]|uniref:Helix-turn-helix domain-containing protein n=1 Tax=Azospirillum picis TaxID=488438 RepID=A0ABU0MHZ7_9PROT|nr:helix-turn-helix domain-containing protein [Azospirillum picis]MBP2299287.1 hypothetical protein [Azospirillum picis]MDQ0533075.1 hypothetical protein [Azospirillum picis]
MTDRTNNPNRWGRIPAWWLDHPQLDADGLAVLAALSTYADETGVCWPSQATLATKLKRSRPTVNRIVGRLEALGLLTVEHRRSANGGRLSCRYRLAFANHTPTETAAEASPRRCAEPGAAREPHGRPGMDIPADSGTDSPRSPASQEQPEPEQIPDPQRERPYRDRSRGAEVPNAAAPPAIPVAEDWQPSDQDRRWASERFPAVDVAGHAERFVQQCRAHGYRYRDTAAAWRSWLLKDMTQHGVAPPSGSARHKAGRPAAAVPLFAGRPVAAAEQRLSAWANVAARLNGGSTAPTAPTPRPTSHPWGIA